MPTPILPQVLEALVEGVGLHLRQLHLALEGLRARVERNDLPAEEMPAALAACIDLAVAADGQLEQVESALGVLRGGPEAIAALKRATDEDFRRDFPDFPH